MRDAENTEVEKVRNWMYEVTLARFDGRFYHGYWRRMANAQEADIWRDYPHVMMPQQANDC